MLLTVIAVTTLLSGCSFGTIEEQKTGDVTYEIVKKEEIPEQLKEEIKEAGKKEMWISYADTGVINIPESIQKMPSIDVDYGYGNQHYDAPTNTSTNALFTDDQKLGSGSYSSLAGWMYTVNNVAPDVAMDSQPVKDGDVIRLQFSVYAGGADLGFVSYYENIESAKLPNKDALTKLVANTPDNPQVAAKAEAIKVLANYDATQEDVDAAYTNLEKVQVTTTTQKTTLKKASIKSLKNVKGKKVKIKINKVTGAKGYQIKYATNKKFKNCKYKNTKKTTYTLTKLKKKSKCYVKVRAYKKSGNQKVYGKWSSPKSVKIKK